MITLLDKTYDELLKLNLCLSCIYCGFCNSQQLALICALFDKSILSIFEQIQMKLDVPFKEWSSVFNFKERLKPKIDFIFNSFVERTYK